MWVWDREARFRLLMKAPIHSAEGFAVVTSQEEFLSLTSPEVISAQICSNYDNCLQKSFGSYVNSFFFFSGKEKNFSSVTRRLISNAN